MRRWKAGVALATVAVLFATAGQALAGKPTIVRENVDETFADEFLSDECGVPVETRIVGHQIIRSYTDGNGRLVEVFTLNMTLTATSAFGTFRFKDVGADERESRRTASSIRSSASSRSGSTGHPGRTR